MCVFFEPFGPANQNTSGLHSTPACAACVPRMPLAALPNTGVAAFGSWSGWWWRGADGFDSEGWGKCGSWWKFEILNRFFEKTCRTCWGILGVRKIVESMQNPYLPPVCLKELNEGLVFFETTLAVSRNEASSQTFWLTMTLARNCLLK